MKKLTALTLAAVIVILSVFMTSCSVDYTEDELKDAAVTLIEKSYEVNEIYFGKGLPVAKEDSDAVKDFTADLDVDIKSVNYIPVSEECQYSTIEDLKKLASEVYTEDYCNYLWKMAFEGLSTDDGVSAVYARYIIDYSGKLTVRSDLNEKGANLNRTYDTENITVEKMKKEEATVKLMSLVDGKEDGEISFVLKREKDGWRLDQPTY